MSLDVEVLRRSLRRHFSTPVKSSLQAGHRIAVAYADYAKDATSCSGAPDATALSAAKALLGTTLGAALLTARTGSQEADSFSVAFSAFWLLPPMVFSGAGLVTVAAQPLLQTALRALNGVNTATVLSGGSISSAKLAGQWANALHLWTSTVIVSHPGLPCSGPLF